MIDTSARETTRAGTPRDLDSLRRGEDYNDRRYFCPSMFQPTKREPCAGNPFVICLKSPWKACFVQ